MNAENKTPTTLIEAVRHFTDLHVTNQFFADVRWPNGQVCCPHCGSVSVKYLAKYRRWECREKHPKRQFTVKVGTVMEDSPLGLDKWAVAFWLEVNAKNSISSYELHRALGITQKSAWFMLHRIRLAVQTKSFEKMGGNGSVVEADETFVGGLSKNMHKDRRKRTITGPGHHGKAAVMGLLERHSETGKSQVRAQVISDLRGESLYAVIHKHVETGTNIYTDAWQAYRNMGPDYYHAFVDHAEKYVDGAVRTNGLENFWACSSDASKGLTYRLSRSTLGHMSIPKRSDSTIGT